MSIAKEGLPFILPPLAAAAAVCAGYGIMRTAALLIAGALFLAAALFCLFFFRDPAVTLTTGEKLVLSPCNGTVMKIVEEKDEYIVRVFLSIFNVHIQRAPVAGTVRSVEHKPGKFLAAWHPEAFLLNEQNVITIDSPYGVFVVRQVAGFLARRCVAYVKAGGSLTQGEKIGLIKFSSQVDLHLPRSASLSVKEGDRVAAGKTIFGVMP